LAAKPGASPGSPAPDTADGSIVNQMLNLSAYAEMMLVHEHACVAINPEMPLDKASVIGCAVTTGAGTIFNACKVTPGRNHCSYRLWRRWSCND
jgi:S-(hydroxymethyl)glutathione dehydrogenase / alcohol dehydrogenase